MADRSVLFRLSNGAFQDVATGDNLVAAGVKRAGTITINATTGNVELTAAAGTIKARTALGTMFEVDLQNGFVIVGSALAPAQLRTNATATLAALRVGSITGDPSTLANGDIWYDSTSNKFRARENGSSVDMIGGGSSSVSPEDVWRLGLLHQVAG